MWKLTHMTKNVSQGEINWNEEMDKGLPLHNQDDKPCTQIVVGDYTNALVGMVAILQQSYSEKTRILTTTPTQSRKQNHNTQPKSQNSKLSCYWSIITFFAIDNTKPCESTMNFHVFPLKLLMK
jgi:hypothetical protein